MTRYQYCLKVVLSNEGGYVDHKSDRGGATNFGVTQKAYDDFCKLSGRQQKPVKEISPDEVEAIYAGYWNSAKCGVIPEPLDLLVFDCAINSGAGRAIKLLQRALGVDEDGIYGRQTSEALREEVRVGGIHDVCQQYLAVREEFYHAIVEKDPSQNVFLAGWLNRVKKLRGYA